MYRIVANTNSERGNVGDWDVEIASEQFASRCQDVVKELSGEYAGGVWYQSIDIEKPTEEEVQRRIAEKSKHDAIATYTEQLANGEITQEEYNALTSGLEGQ